MLFSTLGLLLLPFSAIAQAQGTPFASATLPEAPSFLLQTQTTTPPQGTPAAPASPSGQTSTSAPAQTTDDQLKEEEKQRLLGIVPAFNAVESGHATPLTPKQKMELWYRSAIDPFTFATAGIDAGIEQAENSYPEYLQGFEGFAKRYGASYADTVDGNFWGNGILPILLKQDPRYFRLGTGPKKKRLWYALISTVRCKGDNGKWQPSYSNVGGNLIGGAISNLYYPASDRGVGLTLERGFTVTAEGAFGAVAYEFYPDFLTYMKHRRARRQAARAQP